jgi:hypothetical protein
MSEPSCHPDEGLSAPTEPATPSPDSAFDSVRGVLGLLCGIAVFLALARVLPSFERQVEMAKLAPDFLPELRHAINPEPREKLLYQLGLGVGTVVPIGVYVLACRLSRARDVRFFARPWFAIGHSVALLAIVVLWLGMLIRHTEVPKPLWGCIATAGASLPLLFAARLRVPGWRTARYVLLAFVGYVVFRLGYCNDALIISDPLVAHHLDLLLGAVNQVSHGHTILVDTSSQYGVLYPYVIATLVRPFGVSVPSICAVFAGLGVIALGWVYLVIRRAARSLDETPCAELLFLGMVGATMSFCLASVFDSLWIYYQYFPLRVVCGCFFFWYVGTFARAEAETRKQRLLVGGYLLAGISLLWNTDTGLVIVVAWTGTALFDSLARRRSDTRAMLRGIATHGAAALLTTFGSVGAYAVFARLRTGHGIDLGEYLRFQNIFYGAGFYMLPMNGWEFWQIMLAVPFVTVFLCLRRWLLGTADELCTEKLFIALYGLGIFSYYQGRSHVQVLLAVGYPTALLGCLFIVDLMKRPSPTSSRTFGFVLKAFSAFAPAAGLVFMCSSIPRMVRVTRQPPTAAEKDAFLSTLEVLRRQNRGTELPVVSNMENFIHLKTETSSPFPFSSLAEVMLTQQLEQLRKTISDKHITSVMLHSSTLAVERHLVLPTKSPEQWIRPEPTPPR